MEGTLALWQRISYQQEQSILNLKPIAAHRHIDLVWDALFQLWSARCFWTGIQWYSDTCSDLVRNGLDLQSLMLLSRHIHGGYHFIKADVEMNKVSRLQARRSRLDAVITPIKQLFASAVVSHSRHQIITPLDCSFLCLCSLFNSTQFIGNCVIFDCCFPSAINISIILCNATFCSPLPIQQTGQ